MKLGDYKLIFVAAGLIGALLIASPAIAGAISLPEGEKFSELYLLGPNQMAENYPSNIAVGQNYSLYLGVGNLLGSSAYYALYVKLGNQTDQPTNATRGTPSPLQPLYEYRFSISDNKNWTTLMTFSVPNATIQTTNSQINTLQINDVTFNVDKPAIWNTNTTAFTYRFFFELWLYNEQTGSIEFNNRSVSLQLNLTRTP
jgi:uncharacterized membrane protein